MRLRRTLIDTGPIVAILSAADEHHERCVAAMAELPAPLVTTWPVVTEAQWLLRKDARGVDALFQAFETQVLELAPLGADALAWLSEFLRRYRRMGAQLADASLVYLAEREGIGTVFTLDRRDFSVYRYGKNRSLSLIPADEGSR